MLLGTRVHSPPLSLQVPLEPAALAVCTATLLCLPLACVASPLVGLVVWAQTCRTLHRAAHGCEQACSPREHGARTTAHAPLPMRALRVHERHTRERHALGCPPRPYAYRHSPSWARARRRGGSTAARCGTWPRSSTCSRRSSSSCSPRSTSTTSRTSTGSCPSACCALSCYSHRASSSSPPRPASRAVAGSCSPLSRRCRLPGSTVRVAA